MPSVFDDAKHEVRTGGHVRDNLLADFPAIDFKQSLAAMLQVGDDLPECSTRGAMTELVRLKHCNPRLAFSEVVGGGKSSEAAANDRDVNAIAPVQSSRRCALRSGMP